MADEKQMLIEALKKSHDVRFTPGVYEHSIYGKAALLLEKSEEVVRCKDCKHYDNSEGIFWCHLNSKFYPGGFDWHSFPEDGFCSYGERRTDERKAD